MAQHRGNEAGREFEEEGFECDRELADSLELDAYDRGEEAALGLIRLTARLAQVDPLDVDGLSDGQFHHELAHALSGFLEGMLISLRQETNIDRGNVNTGLLRVVDALALREAEDDDDGAVVTEIEDESLARSRTVDAETATRPKARKTPGRRKSKSGAKPPVSRRAGKTRK